MDPFRGFLPQHPSMQRPLRPDTALPQTSLAELPGNQCGRTRVGVANHWFSNQRLSWKRFRVPRGATSHGYIQGCFVLATRIKCYYTLLLFWSHVMNLFAEYVLPLLHAWCIDSHHRRTQMSLASMEYTWAWCCCPRDGRHTISHLWQFIMLRISPEAPVV